MRRLVITKAGIGQEMAIDIERLRRVLQQNVPIIIDVQGETEATPTICGIVPVVLDEIAIECAHYRVRTANDLAARGERRSVTGRIVSINHEATRRECGFDIVNPATLTV